MNAVILQKHSAQAAHLFAPLLHHIQAILVYVVILQGNYVATRPFYVLQPHRYLVVLQSVPQAHYHHASPSVVVTPVLTIVETLQTYAHLTALILLTPPTVAFLMM